VDSHAGANGGPGGAQGAEAEAHKEGSGLLPRPGVGQREVLDVLVDGPDESVSSMARHAMEDDGR